MFGVVHHRLPVVSAVSKVSIFAASEVRREAIDQRSCNRVATRLTECLFLGVKRTSPTALHMSAFDPKRTCTSGAAIGSQRHCIELSMSGGTHFLYRTLGVIGS